MKHGTVTGYGHHRCRCDACCQAASVAAKRRNADPVQKARNAERQRGYYRAKLIAETGGAPRRVGRPPGSVSVKVDPLDARVLPNIEFAPDGCWLWKGRKSGDGYAFVWAFGKHRLVHRLVYERVMCRPIPAELELHHVCRVRHCVNPGHLQLIRHEDHARLRAECRCGTCLRCRRNAYNRKWYRDRKKGLLKRDRHHIYRRTNQPTSSQGDLPEGF